MIISRPTKLKEYQIEGLHPDIAGEWKGQKSSHWHDAKRYYEYEINEGSHIDTFKKHFIDKQEGRGIPKEIVQQKRHYGSNISLRKSKELESTEKLHWERRHYNYVKNSMSKYDGQRKLFPDILSKDTNLYTDPTYPNVFFPSKNEVVSLNFLSQRNLLPVIQNEKNCFKKGIITNLYRSEDSLDSYKRSSKQKRMYIETDIAGNSKSSSPCNSIIKPHQYQMYSVPTHQDEFYKGNRPDFFNSIKPTKIERNFGLERESLSPRVYIYEQLKAKK